MQRREFLVLSATLPAGLKAVREDPIDELTDLAGGLSGLPGSEYERRLERARQLMARRKLDAFFAEGGSTLAYFTGVSWGRSERAFGVIIARHGQPIMICPAFEERRARERMGAIDADLRVWQEHESPFQLIRSSLSDLKAGSGRIGVEPTTRHFLVDGISKAMPGTIIEDGRPVSDGCRMRKSKLELDYMRVACRITKSAYEAAFAGLEEGMSPGDLGSRISRAHARMGARGGAMVLFGPAAAFPHGTRERRPLQPGDAVLVDGGCKVHSYSSDISRTMFFGEAGAKQKAVYEIVKRAQTAALQAARPGIACQELDRVARRVVEEAGYGPGYSYFTHRLGHGIGLDGHESPYLVEGNTLSMEPGMTFSNEPGIYLPGEFGVRLEDIMVITEDGAEFL